MIMHWSTASNKNAEREKEQSPLLRDSNFFKLSCDVLVAHPRR